MKPDQAALKECQEAFPEMTWEIQCEDNPIFIRGTSDSPAGLIFEVLIRGDLDLVNIAMCANSTFKFLRTDPMIVATNLSEALEAVKNWIQALNQTVNNL